MNSISNVHSNASDDWYTPRYIFDALNVWFSLDVAAPEEGPRYVPADQWYYQDGETRPWFGTVWMNPPYGHQAGKMIWLEKFFNHRDGIALMPDRTSTPWFQKYAPMADVLLFMSPKVKFERPDGTLGESPGNGTCLMGVGEVAVTALHRARHLGLLLQNVP